MYTSVNRPPSDDNSANDVIQNGTNEVISSASTAHLPKDDNYDVYECEGNISTKSTIEKAVIEIYERHTQGRPIFFAERSIMSSGLRHHRLLNANEDGQQLLFGAQQLMKMHAQYEHTFKETHTFARPYYLNEALTHINCLCKRSEEAAAREHLTKDMEASDVDKDSVMGLRPVLQLSDSLIIHCTMFDPL